MRVSACVCYIATTIVRTILVVVIDTIIIDVILVQKRKNNEISYLTKLLLGEECRKINIEGVFDKTPSW